MIMFGKKLKIIAVSRNKIAGAVVGKKILRITELGWDEQTLDLSLAKIKDELKIKTARLLLGNDISYVVRLKIPVEVKEKDERKFIASELSEKIPEDVDDADWDYKEIEFSVAGRKQHGSEREVVVFSPVRSVFAKLSKALRKLDIEIEAVEPEALAKTRDENPIIGIALKEDIKGKDEDVLNLELVSLNNSETAEISAEDELLLSEEGKRTTEENGETEQQKPEYKINKPALPSSGKNNRTLLIMVGTVIFIAILTFSGWFLFFNKKTSSVKTVMPPEPTLIIRPTETEDVQPESGEQSSDEVTDISTLKMRVLNGSGTPGEAGVAAELLGQEGFLEIETENASSYDYLQTEVRMKENLSGNAYDAVKDALSGDYSLVLSGETLPQDTDYDMEIIIGKRR